MPVAEIEIIINPKTGETEWETHNIADNNQCNNMLKVFQRGNDVLDTKITSDNCLPLPDYQHLDTEE